VLLVWKDGTAGRQIDTVGVELGKLADDIEEIRADAFGPDAGVYRGNARYALIAEFASKADLKTHVMQP
jgi:hypothetical protein